MAKKLDTVIKINNRIKAIKREAQGQMEALGTWKPEFEDALQLYADTKLRYEQAMAEFIDRGMEYTVMCAGGVKKNPVLIVIEESSKALTMLQDKLFLNPKSLDAMRQQSTGEESALGRILEGLNGKDA